MFSRPCHEFSCHFYLIRFPATITLIIYRREIATFPVRTNQIPRAIPQQQWYMHPVISCLLGGILPFGAVSVELYFIMSALWLHQVRGCLIL